jgi:hypothetical protein
LGRIAIITIPSERSPPYSVALQKPAWKWGRFVLEQRADDFGRLLSGGEDEGAGGSRDGAPCARGSEFQALFQSRHRGGGRIPAQWIGG